MITVEFELSNKALALLADGKLDKRVSPSHLSKRQGRIEEGDKEVAEEIVDYLEALGCSVNTEDDENA